MSRVIPIDDALREVEATLEAHRERPSPYRTTPTEQILDYPCTRDWCPEEFHTLAGRNAHMVEAHLRRTR